MNMGAITRQIQAAKQRVAPRGRLSEKYFISSAQDAGWRVYQGSEDDDIAHTDFIIRKSRQNLRVDVKGQKSVETLGFIWVELKNVIGKKGWLYGSADAIAFETPVMFIVVPRESLARLVEANIVDKILPYPKPWHKYCRKDRKDLLTVVPLGDIIRISEFKFIKKQVN